MQISERAHCLPDIILSPGDTKPSKICGLCLQEAYWKKRTIIKDRRVLW